jgi:hypothetical protein
MGLVRRRKFLLFLLLLVFLLSLYIFSLQRELSARLAAEDFSHFNNVTGAAGLIVPNLVHFIHFDQESVDFVALVCILSAFYNHEPSIVYLHTNVGKKLRTGEKSRYLRILEAILGPRLLVGCSRYFSVFIFSREIVLSQNFLSYTERRQGQILSLLFGNFSKKSKIIDKNLFSAREHRIFRHPKVGKDILSYFFLIFSYLKHLKAFDLQTQQGHFHPWSFLFGLKIQV